VVVGSKESGLDVNVDKTKYIVMSRDQNAGRSHNIKIDNSSFERVEQFKLLFRKKLGADPSQEMLAVIRCRIFCHPVYCANIKKKIKIYRSIFLTAVLYGFETWSLTLREEHGLKVFENRVLRKIFGSKRNEVTGEWRKLQNEELSDLYSSPDIVRVIKARRMSWAGHVAGEESCIQSFGGET
jgi:hypothetical protein